MSNIVFTICGRAGSKGFKNKNIQLLRNQPLVYYTLAAIDLYRKEYKEDNVTVLLNTDSEDLIKQVKSQSIVPGVSVIEREPGHALDNTPKVHVIQDTYRRYRENGGVCDVVVDLDITSPIRRVSDIRGVIDEYWGDEYDLTFSVVEARRSPSFNMIMEKPDGSYVKASEGEYTARQQAPKYYDLNASIYAYNPCFLEKEIDKTILAYKYGIYVMQDYYILDIDSEEDFRAMNYMMEYYCKCDKDLAKLYDMVQQFNKIQLVGYI